MRVGDVPVGHQASYPGAMVDLAASGRVQVVDFRFEPAPHQVVSSGSTLAGRESDEHEECS